MRTPPLNPVQINDIVEAEDDYTQLEFIPTEDEQTELVQLELGLHENKRMKNIFWILRLMRFFVLVEEK